MVLATMDEIVRRGLLENNLSIHFYSEFLYHGCTCVRELNYDTLQIVNTVNLPTNDYAAADLPDDFDDDIAVCIASADRLLHLPKQESLNPIRIHSTTDGAFVPYINQDTDNGVPNVFYGFASGYNYYWNVNDYAEFTGRRFGAHGGISQGYKIIRERRQIQMTDNFINSNIILMYISNGQSVNNATQIDYKAFQTIRSYQDWMRSPNKNNENSPEGRKYLNQKRLLKARLNDLTKVDIQNIVRLAYTAGIKF
jgi:hypothetical protein